MSEKEWEFDLSNANDTLLVPCSWPSPDNLGESLFRASSPWLVSLLCLLTLFPWVASGIRLELGVDDKLALLGLEDCRPEKYSDLIK